MKAIWGLTLILLFSSVDLLNLASDDQLNETPDTIYINTDGTVEPSTAPIMNVGNTSYILTGNISDSIVVKRDNIVIDGAGYTVQGNGSGKGVDLTSRNNITIKTAKISEFYRGVYLESSRNIALYGNIITNNTYGIEVGNSIGNILINNNVSNNEWDGIYFYSCDNNTLYDNTAQNNRYGIVLSQSSNNKIFHNNFIRNRMNQTHLFESFNNVWDRGYLLGGNYWNNYTNVDSISGHWKNETGSDGIGDIPYTIDDYNRDSYPLMAPLGSYDANIRIISNSTVSRFDINEVNKTLSFNVTGDYLTKGFCRVIIQNAITQTLWQSNYTVLFDGQPIGFKNWTDLENTYLYFAYQHSEHEVIIVPEFPSSTVLIFFIILSVVILGCKNYL